MKTSEQVEELFKAYVRCTPELLNIAKDSKGYGYKYTSLEKLIEHTKPTLAEHDLAILQFPTGSGIITRMVHSSGEWIEQELTSEIIQLKGMNVYQVQGSQITYLRRYGWASICGIASDEDIDAQGEQDLTPISKITQDDVLTIQSLIAQKNIDSYTVLSSYNVKLINDLTDAQAKTIISRLNKTETKAS